MRILTRKLGIAINIDGLQKAFSYEQLEQGKPVTVGEQQVAWNTIQTALSEAGITDITGDIEAQRSAHAQAKQAEAEQLKATQRQAAQTRLRAAQKAQAKREAIREELRRGGLSVEERLDAIEELLGIMR